MLNLIANTVDLAHAAVDELLAHLPGGSVPDPTPAAGLCAVPGCRRRATVGRLCGTGKVDRDDVEDGGHLAQLGRWLRDIQTETERLCLDPDDPDAWLVLPSTSTRWDGSGGATLASQRTPAVLEPIAYTDPRTTAHGRLHIGPLCRRCPTLLARPCTCPPAPTRLRAAHYDSCPRYGMHSSCLDILLDRDEHGADRPIYVLAVLRDLARRVRDGRLFDQPVESWTDCTDRVPGTPRHGPAYGLPCLHDSCQGVTWQRTIPVPPTIASERQLLTKQLGWIAEQDWVIAMREQLADLRAQLMAVTRNADPRPLTGYCYKSVDDQGTECGGSLWPVYAAWDSDDDGTGPLQPREVVCERDPTHRWKGGRGGDLARLSMYLEQQRGVERKAAAETDRTPAARGHLRSVSLDDGLEPADRLRSLLEQQRREDELVDAAGLARKTVYDDALKER